MSQYVAVKLLGSSMNKSDQGTRMISVDPGVGSGGESGTEEQREAGPMRASRSPWIRSSSLVGILMGLSDYMANIESSNHSSNQF